MLTRIRIILEMIKFEHTVFALPFALVGALLAANGIPSWGVLFWISVAMVGARSAAMGFNRWTDRHIDAQNPRTKTRALPAGLVTPAQVQVFIAVSSAVFLFAAYMLNPLSFALSPLALALIFFYSYTKRFTYFSHAFLGLALAIAPIGAWIAVSGTLEAPALVLGGAVLFWLVGFDTLYALQDVEFDREAGLHSIPQRFGVHAALRIARAAHVMTVVLLLWLSVIQPLGCFFFGGVVIAAGILAYEHSLVSEKDLSKLNIAFFNMNGYLSVTVFVFTLLDVLV